MRRSINSTLAAAKSVVASLKLKTSARVLDLGCGNGVFLQAIGEALKTQYADQFPDSDAIASVLTGVEINPEVATNAKTCLTKCFGEPADGWDIRTCDALELGEDVKYDFIIGNPPWIRLHDIDTSMRSRLRSKFVTAKGAFDICYLFIEKALHLLSDRGELALVVPGGIQFQPAAGTLRTLLSNTGEWSIRPLGENCFEQSADVHPAVLLLTKADKGTGSANCQSDSAPTFGDIATVTNGVATGANSIFLVDQTTVREWHLERDRLRPVVRGRNISAKTNDIHFTSEQLIWPYTKVDGRWELDALLSSPCVLEYLESHRIALTSRPRLADLIRDQPSRWYQFIDPGRVGVQYTGMRIAMPVVFRDAIFALVTKRAAVVLNSCLEIFPKPGCEDRVLATLRSEGFWSTLRKRSRILTSDYRRTSVTELRSVPLTNSLL